MAKDTVADSLEQLLPEKGPFPAQVDTQRGRTLYKSRAWWKAVLLVKGRGRDQERLKLRLYGWQWDEEDNKWKRRQNFNVPRGKTVDTIIAVLRAFAGERVGNSEFETVEALTGTVTALQAQLEESQLQTRRTK